MLSKTSRTERKSKTQTTNHVGLSFRLRMRVCGSTPGLNVTTQPQLSISTVSFLLQSDFQHCITGFSLSCANFLLVSQSLYSCVLTALFTEGQENSWGGFFCYESVPQLNLYCKRYLSVCVSWLFFFIL